VIPTVAPTINHISAALKNLALAALNNTTVLQQLTAANLLLAALVTSLMAANKKLAEALARNKGVALLAVAPTMEGGAQGTSLSKGIIAGPMVIKSAKTTQVRPAGTRLWGTRTMRQAPTQ
jgi:hypothetical protein